MKKIGITGNIASGKSEVEKILVKLGYKTICADKIVHKLFSENLEVQTAIEKEFKMVDRKKIAEIIFNNPDKKKALEKIIHPKVIVEIENFFLENASEKLVFAFVPLLFEAKLENIFDETILISAHSDVRLGRILARDNSTVELARLKMRSQMSEYKKIKLVNYIIENNSTIKVLEGEIASLLAILCH